MKKKENEEKITIDIKEESKKNKIIKNELVKVESGIYHDEHGKLLYKPDEEFEIRTCCGQTTSCDKNLLEFIAKFAVSSSVLGFSMYQLAINNGDSSYFSSCISLVLGVWVNNNLDKGGDRDKKK